MSFWNSTTGENVAASASGEYEQPQSEFEPIPHDTTCLATITEAGWSGEAGAQYIRLRWTVLEPVQFLGRSVVQKLWVNDPDPRAKSPEAASRKRDNALRMLAAIDRNCGAQLSAISGRPTDEELQLALCNQPVLIRVLIWELNGDRGEKIRGNWVSAVLRANGAPNRRPAPSPATAVPARAAVSFSDLDDEIPF